MFLLSAAFNWLGASSGREASHGRRGLCLVHFMLNSVSISWLLPSLQQKSRERSTNPQKSSGFDRRSVQSFIPRPRAMELCQQTFHWNHIKPLLFPQFCTFPALPLSLSISLCRFILHFLLPIASSLDLLLPTFAFLLPHPLPSGVSGPLLQGF